jgi:hypothetical protein
MAKKTIKTIENKYSNYPKRSQLYRIPYSSSRKKCNHAFVNNYHVLVMDFTVLLFATRRKVCYRVFCRWMVRRFWRTGMNDLDRCIHRGFGALVDEIALAKAPAPKITNEGRKGWRIDFPDGDYGYQPSQSFAKAAARAWAAAKAR